MDQYTEPHFDRSALLTIDMQNDFSLDNAPARIDGTTQVIQNIVQLLNAYRNHRLPIIHVVRLYFRDGSNVDLCRRQRIESGEAIVAPGSDGAELVSALKPAPDIQLNAGMLLSGERQSIGSNEYVMYKPRWGAFYGTTLEAWLHEMAIDTLVVTGCNYPNCPRTSIYEASERDFRVVVAPDAVSQLSPKDEEELCNTGTQVIPAAEIVEQLS